MYSYKTIVFLIISVLVTLSATNAASNLRSANDNDSNVGSELEVVSSENQSRRTQSIGVEDCKDRCKCSNDGIDKSDGRIILFSLVKSNPIAVCVDRDFASILVGFLPILYSCAPIKFDAAQNTGTCPKPVNGKNED